DGAGHLETTVVGTPPRPGCLRRARRTSITSWLIYSMTAPAFDDDGKSYEGRRGMATDISVASAILFSRPRPIIGWWRHKDLLQIPPAPPNAPRCTAFLHADHPFVIQFPLAKRDDGTFDNLEYLRTARKFELLLNSLLRGSTDGVRPNNEYH